VRLSKENRAMNDSTGSLSAIRDFRLINDSLGTAGQPTEIQFRALQAAGFEVVVNLALPTSDNALANEGSIVSGLGMSYVHIPVNFENPRPHDFESFCQVMNAFKARRVFVHCAANMRVSAFVFLYRVLHQRSTVADAEQDLHAIWQPDEIWSRFIKEQLGGPA
jgi:protein tyrosine phosphatase (PTP) superfamily phosphohydrolase (DUF442 family)